MKELLEENDCLHQKYYFKEQGGSYTLYEKRVLEVEFEGRVHGTRHDRALFCSPNLKKVKDYFALKLAEIS